MHLALFQPDIPQNTGSLIRLAACMDVPLHIIEPCGFPLDDKKLKRATLDYYDLASITRHASWEKFLQRRRGRLVLLTTKSTQPYTDFAFAPDDMLLLGRESAGVPPHVHEICEARLTIPMQSGARSLNMAQAAAMVLAEGLRQTDQFPKMQS